MRAFASRAVFATMSTYDRRSADAADLLQRPGWQIPGPRDRQITIPTKPKLVQSIDQWMAAQRCNLARGCLWCDFATVRKPNRSIGKSTKVLTWARDVDPAAVAHTGDRPRGPAYPAAAAAAFFWSNRRRHFHSAAECPHPRLPISVTCRRYQHWLDFWHGPEPACDWRETAKSRNPGCDWRSNTNAGQDPKVGLAGHVGQDSMGSDKRLAWDRQSCARSGANHSADPCAKRCLHLRQ